MKLSPSQTLVSQASPLAMAPLLLCFPQLDYEHLARFFAEVSFRGTHIPCSRPKRLSASSLMRRSLARSASMSSPYSPARSYIANLAVAPSHFQLKRGPLLNSWRPPRRLLFAPGRWCFGFRFQLRQLELDYGYGFFNRPELFADALDGFLVTHRSLVASPTCYESAVSTARPHPWQR